MLLFERHEHRTQRESKKEARQEMMGKGKEDVLSFWLPLYTEPQRTLERATGQVHHDFQRSFK